MTTRSPEHNPHERAADRELGSIDARLDDLERRIKANEDWQADHDAAELAAARQLVKEARASQAEVTGKLVAVTNRDAAIVLDARKTRAGRRWDLAKMAIALALSSGAGIATAQWQHAKHFIAELLGISTKGP